MKRVTVNPEALLIDVEELYNIIEKDLVDNARGVLWQYDYYTKKYRGDLLNNVNVGILQNPSLEYVAQVYIDNGNDIIKTHLVFSRDLRRISRVDELINTFKPKDMKIKLPAYSDRPLKDRLKEQIELIKATTTFESISIDRIEIEGEDIVYTLKGNN